MSSRYSANDNDFAEIIILSMFPSIRTNRQTRTFWEIELRLNEMLFQHYSGADHEIFLKYVWETLSYPAYMIGHVDYP